MNERVMVVTGAFATHTTKLYNYYVCPSTWDLDGIEYIAVVYFGELKYIGKVNRRIDWSFNEPNRTFTGLNGNRLDRQIINDLQKFEAVLNIGTHVLFELSPILNNLCRETNLRYQGRGAFTQSHRYFPTLPDFFESFLNIDSNELSIEGLPTSFIDTEILE